MRVYFRHARTLNRRLLDSLEEHDNTRLSLGKRIAALATRGRSLILARAGRLEITSEFPLRTREDAFSLLNEAARRGMPLGREAERSVGIAWKAGTSGNGAKTWQQFREILGAPYPAVALRSMHRLGLLADILPEFRSIDSLVIRDFYHRYTVDEHTLRTIEHLQELAQPRDERGAHFTDLWKSVERRELLILALLLHDVGKGMPDPNHVTGSLEALDAAAARLHLEPDEKEETGFLIGHHLDMSATLLRRDIFDPETITAFGNTVATPERLGRLCLLTYADIHAVNPEALTPWKAEMLWQLLAATSNHLSRSVDRDRLHAVREAAFLDEVLRCSGGTTRAEIEAFLEGFPRRYLAVHTAAEIATHFALAKKLTAGSVQTELKPARHTYTLTLLAQDRPRLFATIAGVLAGWGMNIIKADAFANAAGVVLDTFQFGDLHRTLELNPSESERLRLSFAEIISGKAPLEPLLKSRLHAAQERAPKVAVPTRIRFDDDSSSRCTLLEILTQDRPGLLHEIGSVLAQLGCNIEVALIDTEGQKAIDVFYLTQNGAKLSPELQHRIATEFWGRI
jgi:[protein-PII] uridylyltransferase